MEYRITYFNLYLFPSLFCFFRHTATLTIYVKKILLGLRHENGANICTIYESHASKVSACECMWVTLRSCYFYIFIYVLNPEANQYFPLSDTLSWIRSNTVFQLEKAWWLMVWISWGGKIGFLIWNSATGKIWGSLNCVRACVIPCRMLACFSYSCQLSRLTHLFLLHNGWEDAVDLTAYLTTVGVIDIQSKGGLSIIPIALHTFIIQNNLYFSYSYR